MHHVSLLILDGNFYKILGSGLVCYEINFILEDSFRIGIFDLMGKNFFRNDIVSLVISAVLTSEVGFLRADLIDLTVFDIFLVFRIIEEDFRQKPHIFLRSRVDSELRIFHLFERHFMEDLAVKVQRCIVGGR